MKLITPNKLSHILFVFLITNTSMFSFISASVSYDNLTNFFAVTALYYMHKFLKKENPTYFLLFVISILGGALTKKTFLPLVIAYFGILIFHKRQLLKTIHHDIKRYLLIIFKGNKFLLGISIIILLLNMALYIENLVLFKRFEPAKDQVITKDQAMKHRLYAQGKILSLYKSGNLSYDEAVLEVDRIKHRKDRVATLYMLKKSKDNKSNPVVLKNRIQYIVPWLKLMLHGTIGILGHITMQKYNLVFTIYQSFFLFTFVISICYWKSAVTDIYLKDAFFLFLFYAIILMQCVTYSFYVNTCIIQKTVQGRYLFPVLVSFYGIVSYFATIPFRKNIQVVIVLIISVFFIWGDFTYFLQNVTPEWYLSNQ